jgi:phosphoribosylformimino-5-aminoimidazole carboxamide ribotide isomerase
MRVIPAIDLRGGRCVRLFQGDFARETEYSRNPAEVAMRFSELAVTDLHVVDLDGARTGAQCNVALVRDIAAATSLELQLGGGIRDTQTLERWFEAGVKRCVIGSVAVTEPARVFDWLRDFGHERIVVGLDVSLRDDGKPMLATHGWTETSDSDLWTCIDRYVDAGMNWLLCTDISRDGTLKGPNLTLYQQILARYPGLMLQASGGVRDVADLQALAQAGMPAAITGRALLDGRISAAEVASLRPNA